MKNQTNRFSSIVIALTLSIAILALGAFLIGAQHPAQVLPLTPMTSAIAANDLRMVMQEQEREHLDQLRATARINRLHVRAVAANDLRMVMQELERERFGQVYSKSFDAAAIACYDPRSSCDR